ncbi:hypothetical protein RJ639_027844 [Escallonia herrerae]|uniref:Uncharacterized protein n=1 Tax=Escallonia herrerae TaxID=1293975 RepID=A0AA88XB18_9ASTE|nr:hypothetical protein RJ639_027844 [Escallonia herrerae]
MDQQLCAKGCGFFGTPANNNLCSKCYKQYHAEAVPEACTGENPSTRTNASVVTTDDTSSSMKSMVSTAAVGGASKARIRCQCCKKRVGVTGGFKCRCGGIFCGLHRYPEEHVCAFDFKSTARVVLAKQNPVVTADKKQDSEFGRGPKPSTSIRSARAAQHIFSLQESQVFVFKKNREMDQQLCARGCGFFGTPANNNLCSKCYKQYHAEAVPKACMEESPSTSINATVVNTDDTASTKSMVSTAAAGGASKARIRCQFCKKKVRVAGFECRCDGIVCAMHRYPEEHFDFKSIGRVLLAKQNPVFMADKLETRV